MLRPFDQADQAADSRRYQGTARRLRVLELPAIEQTPHALGQMSEHRLMTIMMIGTARKMAEAAKSTRPGMIGISISLVPGPEFFGAQAFSRESATESLDNRLIRSYRLMQIIHEDRMIGGVSRKLM